MYAYLMVRTPAQVTSRVDRLIKQIREMQKPNMHGEKASDIVLVCFRKAVDALY